MKTSATIAAGLAMSLAGSVASAADWPEKTVQLIVPSKPGGGTDVMARIFADYLGRETGGDIIVVNVPDGGGSVAYNQVMSAAPDGHTLLFNHTGLIAGYHTGHSDIGVDDFTTVAIAQSYPPQVYAVAPDAPWDTLKDYVGNARENPGERTIAVSLGRTTHFIAGLLMDNEDIDLKLLESSAEVDKVAAIQGGYIDLGNLGVGSADQYQEAGDMKVLCLIAAERQASYPEIETCIEQGVDLNWLAPLVVWGPDGMDPELVEQINAATENMGTDETAQAALAKANSGFTYHDVSSAQSLIAEEDAKIKKLADTLGLAPE